MHVSLAVVSNIRRNTMGEKKKEWEAGAVLFHLFLLFPPVPLFSPVSSCFSFFLLFLVFFFFILFLLFLCSQPRTLVFLSATESSRGEQQVILTNCFKQLFALFPSAGSTPWRGREEPPVFAANHALCSANLTVTHNTTSRNTHCNTTQFNDEQQLQCVAVFWGVSHSVTQCV